ncbi:MAG: hypothetical protein KGL15_07405 [Acidobacteriota bacterium]|nr:hypothetical protein [Acidobacteriota bacterium]
MLIIVLLVAVVWVVSAPLRHAAAPLRRAAAAAEQATPGEDPGTDSMRRLDLESARDAKYREIRDAELDHQTGKLSDEDYEAIDSTLRSEAIALLHELDALVTEPDG